MAYIWRSENNTTHNQTTISLGCNATCNSDLITGFNVSCNSDLNSDLSTGLKVTCNTDLITGFNVTYNSDLITNTTSTISTKHDKTHHKLTNEQLCRRRRKYQNNTFNTLDKLKRITKSEHLNLGIKGYEKDYTVLRFIRNQFWVSGQDLFGQNSVYIYNVKTSTGKTPKAETIAFKHKKKPRIITFVQLHTGEIIILAKIKVKAIFKSDTKESNWKEFMVGKKESRIDDIFVHGCQFSVIDCVNGKLKTWTLKGSKSNWKIGQTLKLSRHSIGDKCNFLLNQDFIFIGNDLNNKPKLLQYSRDGKFIRDYSFESYPKLCVVSLSGLIVVHTNNYYMKIFNSILFQVERKYGWMFIGRINDIIIGHDMKIWVLANARKGVRPLQLYTFTLPNEGAMI